MWLLMLFLLSGPVIIGVGIREALHDRRLRREGVSIEGLVVRHRSKRQQGKTTYLAVVNFVDAQGNPHEFEAKSSGVKGLPVGGPAPVHYLPGAPKTARLDISGKRLESIITPFVVGIAFTAAGIWGLFTDR